MPSENGDGDKSQHGTPSESGSQRSSDTKKMTLTLSQRQRRANRLFLRRGSSSGVGSDGESDPMDSVRRRDAFLSGPLHGSGGTDGGSSRVESGSFNFSFTAGPNAVESSGGSQSPPGDEGGDEILRKFNSLQLRQQASLTSMPENEEMARFAEGTKSHPAFTNTSSKFKHCFMRTLYPSAFVREPGVVLQAKAVACTTGGELIIAGGSLLLPGEKHNKGWVAVWEKSSDDSWGQWDTGLDQMEHPVNDLAVLGNMLVVGHSYPPVIPDGGSSLNRHVSIATGSFAGQERELGEITLWHINGSDADLQPCPVEGIEPYACDVSGVTAVRWLNNPLDPSDSDPPDGCIVASATVRGVISLYCYSQESRSLNYWIEFSEPRTIDVAEQSKISDLSFLNRMGSEDEDMLLACAYCNQKTVWIWKFDPDDLNEQLKPRSKLLHSREVQSARFRKILGTSSKGDADVLLTAAMDYSLRMWDIDNNRVIRILQNNASHFTSCAFSFQGHLMAAGCQSGEILVYDTHTGLKMRTMIGHTDEINKVMLLPGTDGGMLASASNDGSVRVWELKSKEHSILGLGQCDSESKLSTVYSLAFGLNSSRVVTVHRDASMRSWSTRTGQLVDSSTEHCKFIFGIDIHPSEHIAATAAHDGTVRLWDLDLAICIATFDNISEGQLPGEAKDREMCAVSFHPSGTWLIAGCFDRRVYLYTREEHGGWRTRCCWHSHLSRVWAVNFSNDGLWMASGAWDTTVKVYRVSDIELPFDPPNRCTADVPKTVPEIRTQHVSLDCGANVWAVVFKPQDEQGSADSTSVLATGSADSILRLWTYSEEDDKGGRWQLTCTLKGHTNTVTDIAWHPTGDMLVSSSFDKTVRLWGKSKSGFVGFGVWSAYDSPTMAVGWGYQDPKAMDSRGSIIAVATMQGVTYLMDATDAGQPFVPFSRAQHILENAGSGAIAAIGDIFNQTPQTLTSLGPHNSGIFLLWGIFNKFQDKAMLPLLLDSAQNYRVSPLLPYSPQNVAVLTLPDYQLVAAIVDTIISMHEAGDTLGVELLSTGYGTLSILQLIKNFPDQAVVMLNHFGMTACEEDVYHQNWNPHQVLVDGVRACLSKDPEITQTRVPEKLWKEDERKKGIPLPTWGMGHSTVHTVAAHATFPHITGMPLSEWHRGSGPFAADSRKGIKKEGGKKTLNFDKLESSFLHVAYNSQDPLLFDTAMGRAIIAYKWNAYGRTYFSLNFGVFLLQLAANMWQAISWGNAYRAGGCAINDGECEVCPSYPDNVILNNASEQYTCECLPVEDQCGRLAATRYWSGFFVLFIAVMQVCMEIYQMCVLGKRYHRKFVRSSWNGYEVILIFILTASGVVSIIPHPPPQVVPAITSLAAFLSCFKILYFARAFSSTGGLVRLVAEIVYDMRFMFLVVFIGIFSATISFWALPQHEYFGDDSLDGHLDDLWDMCFFVFSIMMSAYEVGYFTHWLSKLYVLCFVLIQAVLLLNALIALMGNTTEKIKENIKVVALHERAGMMLEMELVLGKGFMQRQEQRPRWLHALVQDKDVAGGKGKDKAGGAAQAAASVASRQEFNEMQEKMSQMMAVQEQMMQKLDMVISKSNSYDSRSSPSTSLVRRHPSQGVLHPLPLAVRRTTAGSEIANRERAKKGDLKKAEPKKEEQKKDNARRGSSDSGDGSSSPRGHRLSAHGDEDAPVAGSGMGVWSRLRMVHHTVGALQSRGSTAGPAAHPVSPEAAASLSTNNSPAGSPSADGATRSIADRIRHKS